MRLPFVDFLLVDDVLLALSVGQLVFVGVVDDEVHGSGSFSAA